MRDPKRIARMLDKLQQLWAKYPDLRLGQLVENLGEFGSCRGATWFIEDDYMEERIDRVLAKGWDSLNT